MFSKPGAKPGAKRRMFIQCLHRVLMVPADLVQSHASGLANTSSDVPIPTPVEPPCIELNPPETNLPQTQSSVNVTIEDTAQPDKYPIPTSPQPVGWLRNVDVERFSQCVQDTFLNSENETTIGEITVFGEELTDRIKLCKDGNLRVTKQAVRDIDSAGEANSGSTTDASSSESSAPGSKGFSSLFDTGSQISMIPVETLRRLKRSFTKINDLPSEQQRFMVLADYRGQKYRALGLVPLLWCLDAFPSVIFNTIFWVVDGEPPNDLIIGDDVKRAVKLAVDEQKRLLGRGPVRKFIKDTFYGSVLRHSSSASLHSRPRL